MEGYFTVAELAEKFNKDPETIRRWIRKGHIEAIISSKKEGYLIPKESISMKPFARMAQERTLKNRIDRAEIEIKKIRKAFMHYKQSAVENLVENEAKKVYAVQQFTRDGSFGGNGDTIELLGIFSTEMKAIEFIEGYGIELDKDTMSVEVWREHFEAGGHSDDDYSQVYIEELYLDDECLPISMHRYGRYE